MAKDRAGFRANTVGGPDAPRLGNGHRASLLMLVLTVAAGVVDAGHQALAQVYVPDDVLTVRERAISDTAPLGVRVGSFIVDPGIEVDSLYDDNIFLSQSHKTSDFSYEAKPALAVQSDWERNAIFLGAEGDFGQFASHSSLDYGDYGLLASGQYDLAYETYLTAALSRAHRHEDLGTLEDPSGNQPVQYTATDEQLGFTRALGSLSLRLLGQNEHVSLNAENDPGDPFLNPEEGLNRDDRHITGRVAYETMPGDDFFVQALYDNTLYTPLDGGNLTSNGGDVRGGIDFTGIGNLSGALFGGYLFRSYSDLTKDTRDPYGGGQVNWSITRLTTLTYLMDTTFDETTVAGGAGVVRAAHRLIARHSFTHKFTGSLALGFDNDRRVGSDALNSTAKLYNGGIGGRYQFSDNVGVQMNYNYRQRNSDLANDSYKDNRVMISLIYMR